LHNPNVSAGAKENSCQVGEEIQGPGRAGTVHDDGTAGPSSHPDAGGKDENRVLGGYKATLKSMFLLNIGTIEWQVVHPPYLTDPNVGDKAKQKAQQILEEIRMPCDLQCITDDVYIP
jgi:hypothetical protein